jgi:hypothetical protein
MWRRAALPLQLALLLLSSDAAAAPPSSAAPAATSTASATDLAPRSASSAPPPAFPGAVGFGASASGGRFGALYRVTTLADSGPGSFRDAVSARNRTIVFDVGGYADLASAVAVSSDLTIAGQTAPGGGFGLSGRELSLSGASNVIIRGLRVRQGSRDPDRGKSAVNIGRSSRVVLDHVSIAFGSWDSLDAVGAADFTVSGCIIADPIGQQFGAHVEVGPGSFVGNVFANAHNRQPLAKADLQFVNNVVYDFEAGFTAGDTAGRFSYDVVSNLFVCGPMTGGAGGDAYFQVSANEHAYAAGNLLACARDGVLHNASAANAVGSALPLAAPWSNTTATIPTLDAGAALTAALAGAVGAAPRDAVDALVLGDVASLGLRGRLYTTQVVSGLPNEGYGELAAGAPLPDSAGGGVADFFARANNISTTDPRAGAAPFGATGYSNAEAYVNSLVLPSPWRGLALDAGGAAAGAASFNPFSPAAPWLLASASAAGRCALAGLDAAAAPRSVTTTLLGLDAGPSSELEAPAASAGLLLLAPGSGGANATGSGALGASVWLLWSPSNSSGTVTLSWLAAGGAPGGIAPPLSGLVLPVALQLVLAADGSVAGAASTDGGATWQPAGVATPPTQPWPPAIEAGIVVSAAGSAGGAAVGSFAPIVDVTASSGIKA